MKKLLFLGAPFSCFKGGSEYQYQIIEYTLKDIYQIYYIFRYPDNSNSQRHITYDYRFQRAYSEYNYFDAAKIFTLIKKLDPDIIYKRGINYITAIGVMYARMYNKKCVAHIASDRDVSRLTFTLQKKLPFDIINLLIKKYTIDKASHLICQTRKQKRDMQHHFGRTCDAVIPNFHPEPEESIAKARPVNVIWVANFKQWKQPERFIDVAERLRCHCDANFIMVGRAGIGRWFQALMDRIDGLDNIEYLGELPIDETNKTIAKSHIFVNTSIGYEGFPNTYIQAWQRRVPVVTLNFDPDDVIKTNRIGFHSKTIDNLVIDVRKLADDHALREEMGKRAKTYASKVHSIHNIETMREILAV